MANIELLHKVLQHIKDTPTEYDPVRWHRDFAGWTLRLALPGVEARTDDVGTETLYDADGERIWISDIGPRAQALLGLTASQAAWLFSGVNAADDLEHIVSAIIAEARATA
ncbi:hypothetical protein AB0E62_00485 [Streptomyces sp. NPDC038707]|uniref:hypothetical protein n=1 Tax=Streptomyces sp. NPDC038707 TaxID=3154329 RepID=UPI0033E3AF4D